MLRKSPITEANFREIFENLGSRRQSRAPSLVRLRRCQAICRLAQLARLLIGDRADHKHRANVLTRLQGRLFGRFRLSANRLSLLFGLTCPCLSPLWLRTTRGIPGLYTQIFSLTALWQANLRRFSRAARAGKFSFKFAKIHRHRCTPGPRFV